jgi:CRISPR/Cas system Type II protein with McrA/HNH and RuvC-like nuclease domain
MTTTTVSAAGEAMPKIDRSAVMHRAWAIFRETYKYPQIKFADIGRKCFGWALRKAWAEAREAARVAAIPAQERAERIERLQSLIAHAGFIDNGPQWKASITAYRDEIRQLQAA